MVCNLPFESLRYMIRGISKQTRAPMKNKALHCYRSTRWPFPDVASGSLHGRAVPDLWEERCIQRLRVSECTSGRARLPNTKNVEEVG